jgi:hypothetical protein
MKGELSINDFVRQLCTIQTKGKVPKKEDNGVSQNICNNSNIYFSNDLNISCT